ncbi:MAG: hypothetical protein MUE46_15945 [Xanthomonadales bacterium]|nr:hypothetical protein [Xanthomonadales bacterium]
MLERLSNLQRHCLGALEVDCFHWRDRTPPAAVVPAGSQAGLATRPVVPTGPLCLVVADSAEASSPLVRALARALAARVVRVDQGWAPDSVLVSLAAIAPTAALSLPTLAALRADPQAKRRSWLKMRSFLALRRPPHPV